MEVAVEGPSPGLIIIEDEYAVNNGFMSGLMISGQIMNDAIEKLMLIMDIEIST